MKSVLLAFFLSILVVDQSRANDAPLVAAASSLRQVWPLLMAAYGPEIEPRITFGSSGNLSRQILQSAPFELFLSANQTYSEQLYSQGKSSDKPTPYTIGVLAWVALPQTPLAQWLNNSIDPNNLAADTNTQIPFPYKDIKKLAIANPAFAPYGQAAMQALVASGANRQSSIKFNLGENAAQALQFALSGATGGGIVPLSLVIGPATKQLPAIVVSEIAATMHKPLIHSMVLIDNPGSSVTSLFNFLLSEQAQQIFEQHGFRAIY